MTVRPLMLVALLTLAGCGSAAQPPSSPSAASAAPSSVLPSTPPGAVPAPKPATLDPRTSALLVLDTTTRCEDPKQPCSRLVPALVPLLDKARAAHVFIVYSASGSAGDPAGLPWKGFDARPDEPVIYPAAYDKFFSGELKPLLDAHGAKTLVVTGASTNVAVMYTATSAVRNYRYQVVIPEDGAIAANSYEHDYALHQLSVLTSSSAKDTSFTTIGQLSFSS